MRSAAVCGVIPYYTTRNTCTPVYLIRYGIPHMVLKDGQCTIYRSAFRDDTKLLGSWFDLSQGTMRLSCVCG